MTNFAIDRKLGINAVVDFVKVELSLKKSLDQKKDIQIYSGFFAGIFSQKREVEGVSAVEEYYILTKDFKTFSLYNVDFFYLMSILIKHRDCRDLTIYKTTIEEQSFASTFLDSITEYFELKSRTELDRWLINVDSYITEKTDLIFIGEDEIISNITSRDGGVVYGENNAAENRSAIPPAINLPEKIYVNKFVANNSKNINYSTKEPMFFKRTTTKPSKKLVDKIKAAVVTMKNNPTVEEVTVESENLGIDNRFDDFDFDPSGIGIPCM